VLRQSALKAKKIPDREETVREVKRGMNSAYCFSR
jgi:hypothetical protein